jgi:peptide deformylase
LVIEVSPSASLRSYVNPTILWASIETIRHIEGSVSMPGVTEEIERHARVRIGYQTLDGDGSVEQAEGLLSVCHQREIEQLDGVFWIERLSRLKRERLVKQYEKQQRGFLSMASTHRPEQFQEKCETVFRPELLKTKS